MSTVTIIYGSTGGNTELVSEAVAEGLEEGGISTTLRRVELSSIADLKKADLTILAAPTYEHGVIQHHFIPFLKSMKEIDLKGQQFAVIGLGNALYDDHYHIESANILENAVRERGGTIFSSTLRISGNPLLEMKGRIQAWTAHIAKLLSEVSP